MQPPSVVSINGQGYTDPGLAMARIKGVADTGQRITIDIHDPELVAQLKPLAGATHDQMLALIRQRLNLPARAFAGIVGVDDVIIATSILVTAIGAAVAINILAPAIAVFVVILAFAVLYALYKNYKHFDIQVKANPITGANELTAVIDL